MKTKQIKNPRVVRSICGAAIGVSLFLFACDDGILNTMIEQKSLAEYMEENPNLRLFMNNIVNYREDIFLCIYGDDGETLFTPSPLGKYGSSEGIAYGEITAVDVGIGIDTTEPNPKPYSLVFVKDGVSPCQDTFDPADMTAALAYVHMAPRKNNFPELER